MSKSRSLTPTNTRSPSRKSTPTGQPLSTGNEDSHEADNLRAQGSSSRVPAESGSSKRKRSSTSSGNEERVKRARTSPANPLESGTMRYRPSDNSNDDMEDIDMGDQHSPTPQPSAPAEKKKRTRTLTTPHQAAVLHALLAQSKFPTTAMREEVGRSIGLSARKVQIWFQNQRQKMRRPKTHVEVNASTSSDAPCDTSSTANVQGSVSDPGPSSALADASRAGPSRRSSDDQDRYVRRSSGDQDQFAYGRYPASTNAYHGSFDAVSQLQGPGVPGPPPSAYRDPSPRPSTGQSSYTTTTSGYASSYEGVSPTALIFAHSLPSSQPPIRRRDPSRTLPPLAFSSSKPGSQHSSSSASLISPIVPPIDHDQPRLSPTNIPAPFALEPQPQWDPAPFSPLPTANFSDHSPRSSQHGSTSPTQRSVDRSERGEDEERALANPDPPRQGRYDPVRDWIVDTSSLDDQQRSPHSE